VVARRAVVRVAEATVSCALRDPHLLDALLAE
jgi:hypothetical protein